MKPKKNRRQINHLCPVCMSTLKLENDNYVCTKDRYKYWLNEFKKYEKYNLEEREAYLKNITNVEMFLQLFANRDNLECEFSTNLVYIIPDNTIKIPDPMMVKKIELSIGRKLTEEELVEDFTFYERNGSYSLISIDGYVSCKIPYLTFPDDF